MSPLCESTICRTEDHGGPRETSSVICDVCAGQFSRNVGTLADTYPDLAAALAGSSNYALKEFTSTGGTMETGIIINEAASQTRADVEGFTRWLVGTVLETKPTVRPPAGTVPDMLRWVAKWHAQVFTYALDRERIIEAVTSAKTAAGAARRAAYPSGDKRVPVPARCAHDIDGQPCGAEMFATIRKDGGRLPSEIQCINDRTHNIPSTDWIKYGRQLLAAA